MRTLDDSHAGSRRGSRYTIRGYSRQTESYISSLSNRFVNSLCNVKIDRNTFRLKCVKCVHSKYMHFSLKCTKTADLHSNLLVSWELVTGGCQGRPIKCTHFKRFTHLNDVRAFQLERPLKGMVILCFTNLLQTKMAI